MRLPWAGRSEATGGEPKKCPAIVVPEMRIRREDLYPCNQKIYLCRMTKEHMQDLRERVTSLRRHL
jgi:hypothetical protein